MRLIDSDLLIDELEKRVRTPRSTMEIVRDIIPMVKRQPTVSNTDIIKEFVSRLYQHERDNWIDFQEYGITWSDIEQISKEMGVDSNETYCEQPKIDIDKAIDCLKSKAEQFHDDGKFYYESGNNQCAALSHSKAFAYEDAIEIIKLALDGEL
jgi:hypothetical protein